MRARTGGLLAGLAVAAALLAPATATAATEFGSTCEASSGESGYNFVSISHGAGSPLPLTAPVSGVISRWTTRVGLALPAETSGIYAQRLQLFRSTGAANNFTLVAQSEAGPIVQGTNTFLTRIPVQAGDYIGLGGTWATLFCVSGDASDGMAVVEPEYGLNIGEATAFTPLTNYQVPVSAAIEPDVDGDGYGDETQDGCPQSALYHEACPVVALEGFVQAGSKAVTVRLTTSLKANVKVTGVANLGKGKKARLKAARKWVTPGKLAAAKLSFTGSLKKRLKELKPSQKLTLKLTASTPNLSGEATTERLTVKLRGQGG